MGLIFSAFVSGLLFGVGLIVSQMTWPPKVLNFLDIAGRWDPSLLIVMIAALGVSAIGYSVARKRRPLCADECQWPGNTVIDARLIAGAVMFGIGWGLVGLCPGPALVNLTTFSPQIVAFIVAMSAGMLLHDLGYKRGAAQLPPRLAADG